MKKIDFFEKSEPLNQRLQDKIEAELQAIYLEYINIISSSINLKNFDPEKTFKFSDYPALNLKINALLEEMSERVSLKIMNGIEKSWSLANKVNNDFIKDVFKDRLPAKDIPINYNNQNIEALRAFQLRKSNGLNLSDRVWNYTNQFKTDIELALDVALLQGTSANKLASELKKYLKQPNKLFRRIRNKDGKLVLSKNAKAYKPGQGVYRSSFKNAQRVARTEINMAYRQAEYLRFQEIDFIYAIEVKRSNRFYKCDICEPLKGIYPKTFLFRSWHSNCRCFAVPIMFNDEEFGRLTEFIARGGNPKEFEITKTVEMPPQFNKYIEENQNSIFGRKSIPYFVSDNFSSIDFSKLNFAP